MEVPGPRAGEEQSSWPHQGPQHFPLLPLESVPLTQKGLANQMERNPAAAVNPRASELSQSGIQGPGPPACSSLCAPGSRESCPPPVPSLWPQNRASCVCRAGTAPFSLPEQTQAQAPGTARPHCPTGPSSRGGPCALAPAEKGQHPVPPDPSRDLDWSPEHAPPRASAQKADNEPSQPMEPAPTGLGQVLWGLAGSSHSLLSQGRESWSSGKNPLPYLRLVCTPNQTSPHPFQKPGACPWEGALPPCPAHPLS